MSCTVRHPVAKRRVLFGVHVVASVRQWFAAYGGKAAPNKAVKPLASSLGRSALRACSGMASPCLPDQPLHAERRLPGR